MKHKDVTKEFKKAKQIENLSLKIMESNATIISAVVAARIALRNIECFMEIDAEVRDTLSGRYFDIHRYAVFLDDFLGKFFDRESIKD